MSNIKIIRPYKREPRSKNTLEGFLYQNGYSKIPGTVELVTPLTDAKGSVLTGIDENSLRINAISNEEVRNTEKARLKALREKLEAEIGEDLSPRSAFYMEKATNFYHLKDGDNVFNLDNPEDAINFYWITQLPIVASSIEHVQSGRVDPSIIKFYVYESENEVENDFNRKKKINDVVATLNKLGEVEIRKVAFMLNLRMPEKSSYKDIYNAVDNYIKTPKSYGTSDPVEDFIRVTSYTPDVLAAKVLIKQLLDDRIVKERGTSIYEGENLIAKSVQDFEIKLLEDPDLFVLFEEKSKSRKLYLNNI